LLESKAAGLRAGSESAPGINKARPASWAVIAPTPGDVSRRRVTPEDVKTCPLKRNRHRGGSPKNKSFKQLFPRNGSGEPIWSYGMEVRSMRSDCYSCSGPPPSRASRDDSSEAERQRRLRSSWGGRSIPKSSRTAVLEKRFLYPQPACSTPKFWALLPKRRLPEGWKVHWPKQS